MNLNENALPRCQRLIESADAARVQITGGDSARIIDCGVAALGGLNAGIALAEICLADLGQVSLVPGRPEVWPGPAIQVFTDQPVAACMASQYAGWQLTGPKFFAMGSGPMRAAYGGETLFDHIGFRERPRAVVGVLETAKMPPPEVISKIAESCGVAPADITLLIAPTASLAGGVQIVARSVETCLHKLHELGFELARVISGHGLAPLPPVAADDLTAIGRTNDAVLYGGQVTLWVCGDDASLQDLGPRIPSSASADHGQPFGQIFERYGRDFYKIDPLLFSPAEVTLINVDTGRQFHFGHVAPDVLRASFAP